MEVSGKDKTAENSDTVSPAIVDGLGGMDNITDVDCCATRLRCSVKDGSLIDDDVLRSTGAAGVIKRARACR